MSVRFSMDYFNHNERIKQKEFAAFRDKILKPIILFFVKYGISKNTASFIGVLFLLIACITNPYKYWWIVFFGLFLYLFFDAIDGGIARYTKTANENGSIVDIICDQLGVVLLTASSMYFYETNNIASLIYANSYIAFIILVVYLNQRNVKTFPFLRVKYVFYGLYLYNVFVDFNVLNMFIFLFGLYYFFMFFVFCKYLN